MCKHEEKKCARCNASFECKPGAITACQCYGITFTIEEKAFIEDRYTDCLCRKCLLQLKDRYVFFREKYLYQKPF